MKKITRTYTFISVLAAMLLLYGCQSIVTPKLLEESMEENTAQNTLEAATPEPADSPITEAMTSESEDASESNQPADISTTPCETAQTTLVSQGGPYGKITLAIPENWNYETYPIDNEELFDGSYGIRFYPKDAAEGYIDLVYADSFGVCGTGLAQEKATIAGQPASIGTYDNHAYWDFIAFQEQFDGIVVLSYDVENWWEQGAGQVMEILDTLSFDTSIKEGGAYVYSEASDIDQIGLTCSLKKISSTGATFEMYNYDADAPTGQLEYGDDFAIEMFMDGTWEEVPVSLKGNYAFHNVSYTISAGASSEQKLNWEWLYGTLAPGTYRIKKSVLDFCAVGDYDKYTVYAQFILN